MEEVIRYTTTFDFDILKRFDCTREELFASKIEYSKMQLVSETEGIEIKNEDPVFEIFRSVEVKITDCNENVLTFTFSKPIPLWVFREFHQSENDKPILKK